MYTKSFIANDVNISVRKAEFCCQVARFWLRTTFDSVLILEKFFLFHFNLSNGHIWYRNAPNCLKADSTWWMKAFSVQYDKLCCMLLIYMNVLKSATAKSSHHKKNFFFKFSLILYLYEMICCLVAKSCPTPWDTMDCSTPDFPALHYFPEFAQTHVHWVSEWCYLTISSTAVLFSSCPQSVQHQGLSQRVGSCTRCLKY